MSAPGPRPSFLRRLRDYLTSHPILCLALLTPGIPEYLSGSSSPIGLVAFPPIFGLLLLANLGLYTAGVLLIREATLRWHLGWASVLTLGVAYGIAEEGLALDTLYNLHAGPVNPLTAGHLLGVNWIWSSQILVFHALYSVALPLYLFDRALPAWRGRSLIEGRRLRLTAAAYVGTIAVLGVAIGLTTYWMGLPVLIGSLLAILGLVLLARALPPDALTFRSGPATASPIRLFLLGVGLFPVLILLPLVPAALGAPFLLELVVAPVGALGALILLLRWVGTEGPNPGLVAFGAGLVVPVLAFGFLFALRLPIGLPVVFGVDLLAGLFLWTLYRRAVRERGGGPVPWKARPMAVG